MNYFMPRKILNFIVLLETLISLISLISIIYKIYFIHASFVMLSII